MSQTETPFSLLAHPARTSEKPCDFYDCAYTMVTIHNGLIRPLNAIYNQAPHVQAADVPDFILYCQAWSHWLHHHHGIEEESFFPDVERITGVKGLMDGNVQQHRVFEVGLQVFDEYVKTCGSEGFDAKKLVGIIDSFGPALREHLGDEIPTLLALKQYEGILDVAQLFRDIDAKVQKESTLAEAAYVATSGAYDLLSSAPAPIRLLISLIATYMRWRGSYKFSPCTGFGKPLEKLHAGASPVA